MERGRMWGMLHFASERPNIEKRERDVCIQIACFMGCHKLLFSRQNPQKTTFPFAYHSGTGFREENKREQFFLSPQSSFTLNYFKKGLWRPYIYVPQQTSQSMHFSIIFFFFFRTHYCPLMPFFKLPLGAHGMAHSSDFQ